MLLREHVPGDHLVREGRAGVPELGSEGERDYLAEGAWEELPGCVQREPGMGVGSRSGRRTQPAGLSETGTVDAGRAWARLNRA